MHDWLQSSGDRSRGDEVVSRYYYFAATLPGLNFGVRPALSVQKYLELCELHLSAQDSATIADVVNPSDTTRKSGVTSSMYSRYLEWDASVRNELVLLRAQRLGKNSDRWLRPADRDDSAVRTAQAAFLASNPLDGELELERGRWNFLDSGASRSVFELDALLAYGIKLKILERLVDFVPEKGESGYRNACVAILGTAVDTERRGDQ